MGPTPLYDALTAFANSRPLRFHMPGHKGKAMPAPEFSPLAALDFTELPPTGDLFTGEGPIREAEELWSAAFGMEQCLFLTGGSTQGVLTALTLACPPGSSLLVDRCCHKSVFHAMALLDLSPVYLERPWLSRPGLPGPLSPQAVEKALDAHPEIQTLCITSPTYYGVLSDISALAALLHRRGGRLVVDAAHGCHLPFLGDRTLAQADLVVSSAHKTLPALGQAALLFSARGYTHAQLRAAASLYGSSSPSYPLMASLDLCRAWMEDEGAALYTAAGAAAQVLRCRFPALTEGDAPLDPARFVLLCEDGFACKARLEAGGIFPEMADRGHVVFIFTAADSAGDFLRLERALEALSPRRGRGFPPPPGLPSMVLTPRKAQFSPRQTLPREMAQGRVAAREAAPYPPGVPIVAPGEVFGKKHLAYLAEIGYNSPLEAVIP